MSIVDEMEFERYPHTCSCCGGLLSFEDWEAFGDMCSECFELYKDDCDAGKV